MRDDIRLKMWLKKGGNKRAHWWVLTLDDLDKTNEKYRQLIAQLQAAKERSKDKPDQK